MMAVRIIEKSVIMYLAPASLPEVWKIFLATMKGLTQLRISGFGLRQKQNKMVDPTGIEPATSSLRTRRSPR